MTERDPLRDIIGTCAAQIGAIVTPILSPLIIGGLVVGLNTGEIEAGSLITVELMVLGITSIVIAPFIVRVPHHILAIAAAIILILSFVLSAVSTDIEQLYMWRILAGLAGGALMATVNAAIAQARSSTFLYGLSWAVAYTVTAILAIAITKTNDVVSYDSVYYALAIAMAIALPFLWLVPRHGGKTEAAPFPRDSIAVGCLLLCGIILIGTSMMAYYAFLVQMALNIGASAANTGWLVAIAQIGGIIGGLLASPLANKFSVIKTLVVSCLVHMCAIAIAVLTDDMIVLGLAVFAETILFITITPLMLTLAANIDKKGRWAAAAGGAFIISTAFGPIVGAALIETKGYASIAWLQVLGTLPAIYIFVRVNKNSCTTD